MFKDRIEAGYALAHKLVKYRGANGIVLAVPKGGVPLGYIVAKELKLPLDLILTKKIGHPLNKEYAIGAVSLLGSFVIPHEDVSQEYINAETERVRARLQDMQVRFNCGNEPGDLKNKTVIIVDDGIATGNTLLATVQILKRHHPAKIVIAVPVSSDTAYLKLKEQVNEMVVLEIPEDFIGVGGSYKEFANVSEEEVGQYLEKSRNETSTAQ